MYYDHSFFLECETVTLDVSVQWHSLTTALGQARRDFTFEEPHARTIGQACLASFIPAPSIGAAVEEAWRRFNAELAARGYPTDYYPHPFS